jgi:cytochrome b6
MMEGPKAFSWKRPFDFFINGALGMFDAVVYNSNSLNPLNHLGSLTFMFLLIQIATGLILSFFYMPSMEGAAQSVTYIMSNKIPYGLFIRTLHRYCADGMIICASIHMIRKLLANRHTSTRSVGWFVGIPLLVFTVVITVSGYLLPMDGRATDIMKFLGLAGINNITFLIMYRAVHVALPILVFAMLVAHFLRISRPPVIPTLSLTLITIGVMAVLVGVFPISAKIDHKAGKYVFDWIALWFVKTNNPMIALSITIGILLLLFILPFVGKKIKTAAVVNPARCSGCFTCITLCPKNAIVKKSYKYTRNDSRLVAYVVRNKCQACGVCVAGCLPQVIDLEGYENKRILDTVKAACVR